MRGAGLDYAKKLSSLPAYFYEVSLLPRIGLDNRMRAQQTYIQLVDGGYCLYSYPPAMNLPE